ncbi:hypothetical protein HCA58_15795 [Micromonospora sp. HNM0581]|uniref:hypothetical protein n=1 Tax=Micromonospora sp. HNM0581 TaxID=2716341 RepID=UPI00146CDD01|nr:hypothetical protein [Micromonospora sp. HNM0581]NLU79819.1 hypothetical protein [Micromonospora sp. HNM0581]
MPSPASVRPMWSATLCALRELTRLALASLMFAVAFGGAAAAETPVWFAADAPSTAANPIGPPGVAPVTISPPGAASVTRQPAAESVRAGDTGQVSPERTGTAAVRPEQAGIAPAGPQVDSLVAPAVREGEQTRRGPPTI